MHPEFTIRDIYGASIDGLLTPAELATVGGFPEIDDLRSLAGELLGFDAEQGYDPDYRATPAVFMLGVLNTEIESKSYEELEGIIVHYEAQTQVEAKIRVLCKRELRKRDAAERRAEVEELQRTNPSYGLF